MRLEHLYQPLELRVQGTGSRRKSTVVQGRSAASGSSQEHYVCAVLARGPPATFSAGRGKQQIGCCELLTPCGAPHPTVRIRAARSRLRVDDATFTVIDVRAAAELTKSPARAQGLRALSSDPRRRRRDRT